MTTQPKEIGAPEAVPLVPEEAGIALARPGVRPFAIGVFSPRPSVLNWSTQL